MGYYTGSGVVTGGGKDTSLKESIYWYGQHNVFQKRTTTITTKNGVSLATAQAADVSVSLSDQTWTSGYCTLTSRGCKGSQSSSSYSRIGDSNLYALTVTATTIQAMDLIGWSPTGWQS